MLLTIVGPILVALFAATSIVVGATIATSAQVALHGAENKHLARLFAFGAGAFLVAVCLDFLPDAWSANGSSAPRWILLGALTLWALAMGSDMFFTPRAPVSDPSEPSLTLRLSRTSAIVLAIALSFHTFLEGTAVAIAFHPLTWNTLSFSLAIILHKLPEGVLWGLALVAVFPTSLTHIRRLLIIPAVCTLAGALLGVFLGAEAPAYLRDPAVGFVAGSMLYIAFTELLPALRDVAQPKVAARWFVLGLCLMAALSLFTG